jgi:CBS-domain-containing membrane protein
VDRSQRHEHPAAVIAKEKDATRMHRKPTIRLAWCLLGAALGISAALAIVGPPHKTFVLASLGGSSVFLFGLTRAAAAQPRALLGGHLGGAAIGIACAQWLGSGLPAYATAVAATLGFMLLTRTVHPPAGANPVLLVYVQANWGALFNPVLLGIVILLAVAYLWSRLYPGLVHYPVSPWEPSPAHLNWGGWSDPPTDAQPPLTKPTPPGTHRQGV